MARGRHDGGGKPHWPSISIGDTGNGLLWAAAVVQALYHRDRTGKGQKVDTAIVNAHLLNASMAWLTPDGSHVADRQHLDGMAMGWNALYRLYRTSDEGWVCIAAVTDEHWRSLCQALGLSELASDDHYATASARRANDGELAVLLERAMSARAASDLQRLFDANGVPCEVSSPDFILRFFDDRANLERGWLTTFDDPIGGSATAIGLVVDFSDTPGKVWGPPLVIGDHSREILAEVGYDTAQIDKLCAQGTVRDAAG